MLINVHDFSGHPFQVHLSRELAARGHEVVHTYCDQYVTGRGKLDLQPDDPESLTIRPLRTDVRFDKYHLPTRLRFEMNYARVWRRFLDERHFDAVISCNVPLFAQARVQLSLQRRHTPWIFWHQDIYSNGIADEIRRKLPRAFHGLSPMVVALEKRQVRHADHVVAIGDPFVAKYGQWNLPTSRVTVIPNWAPLDDIQPVDRDNHWAQENGLPADKLRLLYSGTLGRKHNPLLLLRLLDALQNQGLDACLTVCSEGVGADDLASAAAERRDVRILGFQPADRFDQVLSSGDIVVALLEPDASNFSIPSKVLSYLAAGRVVVGLMPTTNPAVGDVLGGGGFVGNPNDRGVDDVARWISSITADDGGLEMLGKQARTYAESRFNISFIGDRFEALLAEIASRRP